MKTIRDTAAATIFLVEDDPVHRMRGRLVLEDAGYAVAEAEDGEQALRAIRERTPDAILLDVGLPGIGGLDVLRALRDVPLTRGVPVLMVTGLDGEDLMNSAFALGAYDFITKPLNDAVLLQRVRSMLLARANQRRLAISEQRLSTLVQNLAGHAIYMLDPRGRIASWNAGAEKLTGYETDAVLGLDFRVFSPDGVPADGAAAAELQTGLREGSYTREGWRERHDGSRFYAAESINPLYDETRTLLGFACILHDRTNERALKEQLHQAQKLEAIGQLTGGLAHDFNNLLGIVIGNIDLCRASGGALEDVHDLLDDALDAALRGAKLTNRLLTFARRQSLATDTIAINELVEGMRRLLEITLGERNALALRPGEGLWEIRTDRSQLEASILNLATNARDAMPDGGRFTLATFNRTIDASDAKADLPAGDYVVLEARDTGVGMSEDVLHRIFEPFFTTKGVGLGTGLGLSMVFGFAAQSGGAARVASAPGKGATFALYFPRAFDCVPAAAAPAVPRATVPVAGETVLAVEDDGALLRVVERELRELGYDVLTAVDGTSALAVLERERIDILFSDVVMPGPIDGLQLAEAVRDRWPSTRIVLSSGYLGGRHGEGDGRWSSMPPSVALLRKPYRREELATALRGEGQLSIRGSR
jgi:PAS domain S-box-containing protein